MRYELYQKIQDHWEFNQDEIMPEYEKRQEQRLKDKMSGKLGEDSDDEINVLPDEKILELAKQIDTEVIQNKVTKLFGIKTPLDATISIKKMDFLFQNDQQNSQYIECLTDAHDQMLYHIQDPQNVFKAMQSNPIDSKNMTYGVPQEFNQLLNQLIQNVNKSTMHEEDDVNMEVDNSPQDRN